MAVSTHRGQSAPKMKICGTGGNCKKPTVVIECGCGTKYNQERTDHETRCPACKTYGLMSDLLDAHIKKATGCSGSGL